MTLQNNGAHDPCEAGAFERLNYYFGKLLTVRDFKAEQRYFNEKRWLLNARTIGWGVVCGLKVDATSQLDTQVMVTPGLALDQYGNEILICEVKNIVLPTPAQNSEKNFYICLQFKSCYSEPVARPLEECGEFQTQCEYNRIRETYHLEVVAEGSDRLKEIQTQCGNPFDPQGESEAECIDFLENPCDTLIGACPPRQPCGWVILAKVTLITDQGGAITKKKIDNCSLRKLLFSNDLLRETTKCLKEQLWKIHTARIDRRQFVPLLAQTIKGLDGRNGRNLILDSDQDFGSIDCKIGMHPFNITTDGECVWFTDQKDNLLRRLSRDGEILECIKLPDDHVSWGIAFDGKEWMWVTHYKPGEEKGKVSRIKISNPHIVEEIPLQYPQNSKATEVVFDDQNMWIAHENRVFLKINAMDYTDQEEKKDWTEDITATITSLAYDGDALWVGYDEDDGLRKIEIKNDEISGAVNLDKNNPQSVCFDGTHIWVGHERGVFKIDPDTLAKSDISDTPKSITKMAFDGYQVWTLQPSENRINRVELYQVYSQGGLQLREKKPPEKEEFKMLAVCFDGLFTWVTAFLVDHTQNDKRTGFVYRLLL